MFRVARGKALTTGRGVRASGEPIRPSDFSGDGDARIADLLARGLVELDPRAVSKQKTGPAGAAILAEFPSGPADGLNGPPPAEPKEIPQGEQHPPGPTKSHRGAVRKPRGK